MTSKSKRRRANEAKASRRGDQVQVQANAPRQTPPRPNNGGSSDNRRLLLLGGVIALVALVVVAAVVATRNVDDAVAPTADPGNTIQGTASDPSLAVELGCWSEGEQLPADQDPGIPLQWSTPPSSVLDAEHDYTALLRTNFGNITFEMMPNAAPLSANNFVCLSLAGYYQNVPFHRIVDDFVIQGGDPSGTGAGGPGYQFADEPVQGEYVPGTVAMANSGSDTNGSQFFIITSDLTDRLPKDYNLFARVIDGQEIVDEIAGVEKDVTPTGEVSRPVEPVILESVTIFVDGEPLGEPAATPAA